MYEEFKENDNLKDVIKSHLSQFPYLKYTINNNYIEFKNDVDNEYIKGLLDMFNYEEINQNPFKVSIKDIKDLNDIEKYGDKIIIENIENIDFPMFNIKDLKVKIDSGATTTSLGVTDLRIENDMVFFKPLNENIEQFKNEEFYEKIVTIIKVQSSNGDEEERPLIKTKIVIRGKNLDCYLSLANRNELEYPVLIGKDVLSGDFLIRPGI